MRHQGAKTDKRTLLLSDFYWERLLIRIRRASEKRPNGCVIWTGSKVNGYAMLWTPLGDIVVHRALFTRAKGAASPGLELDQMCKNRACINTNHLELVTGAENVRRGRATGPRWEAWRRAIAKSKIGVKFTDQHKANLSKAAKAAHARRRLLESLK